MQGGVLVVNRTGTHLGCMTVVANACVCGPKSMR